MKTIALLLALLPLWEKKTQTLQGLWQQLVQRRAKLRHPAEG